MCKHGKERHFIMIKGTVYEKGRLKVNLFVPSNININMKEKPLETQE